MIEHKGPKVDDATKTQEELGLEVNPGIKNVLNRLGFTRRIALRKERQIMMLGDVELSLDRVDELGDLVEPEYKGSSVGERARSSI